MASFKNPYSTKPKKGPFDYEPVKIDFSKIDQQIGDLNKEIDGFQDALDNSKPEGQSFGDTLQGGAGDILKFGVNQYANFQQTASSNQESDLQTVEGAVSGAALGMQLGGPWGAAGGAIVGAGLGLIDKKNDAEERMKIEDQERRKFLEERKADRAQAYAASQGKQKLENEKDTRFNQFKFNNPRFA